ncbi:phosphodiester glycosidase family protein [Clostridium paridis]|nr:phosphodiester glycosidase family protein [Clostridium paridis]
MDKKVKRMDRYKKKSKVKKGLFHIGAFILANIIITMCISIPLVVYGPLENIREYYITTAMTTLSHKYLATMLFSQDEIDKVMAKNKIEDDKNSTVNDISVEEDKPAMSEAVTSPYDGTELIDISNGKYKGYVLIIKDPKRVTLGIPDTIGKSGKKLEDIVKQEGAIAGINAGGFQDDNGVGNGGTPLGVVIHNGKVLYGKENKKYEMVGFNESGILVLGNYTLSEMRDLKIKEAITFFPYLIVDGEPTIKSGNGGWGIAPRTAIGQRKDGSIVMLVIDGRQILSPGATLKEVQDILLKYDVYNATNLDGGASTIMYYKDKIVNKPSSSDTGRYLPSAFIIK